MPAELDNTNKLDDRNKIEKIYDEILLSKKYSSLYAPLIMRVCREEYPKYKKDKDRVKAVKNKLHIIYGAFFSDECHKKANALISLAGTNLAGSPLQQISQISEISIEIMRLHASTNERLNLLEEFYSFIFNTISTIGQRQIESILDIGCGFNPFSIPFMMQIMRQNKQAVKKYYAYDIDYRTVKLLNIYFDLLHLPGLADNIDIIAETPRDTADVAFIFKLIPVLEIQSAGRGFTLLQEINAEYIAVTYPVKSLCGKDKGMAVNYANSFEKGIAGSFQIVAQKIIGNELVYIIKRIY